MEFDPSRWTIRPLDPLRDVRAVAALYLACADYVLLETGEPVRDEAAVEVFTETPTDHPAEKMLKHGIFDAGQVIGLIDVARDFPASCDWYLGLLMLDPAARGRGIGAFALREIERMAEAEAARRLLICVFDENPRGLRFWQRQGFVSLRPLPPRRFGAKMHARQELVRMIGAAAPGSPEAMR